MQKQKKPLAFWIFVGLLVGVVGGLLLMNVNVGGMSGVDFANTYIKPFGTIFLNLVKFIVIPIVILSITSGVISMKDIRQVGSVGVKTLVYYLCTTAVAIIIALTLASLCKGFFPMLSTADAEYTAPDPVSFMDTLVNIFPSNPITPLANASMLQVIVIALLLGFGILLAGEKGRLAAQVVESFNEVAMKIMDLIIRLSPIGVACLLAPVVAENGPKLLAGLAIVLLVAYVGYILHALVVYSLTVKTLAGLSPVAFFKGMVPAMMMAFSSASSVGTLPFTLDCAEKLGARKEVASFVVPLGATINMDGTAIYQGVCAVFIAACYGIHLTLPQMASIILTATLASIGTAGVPGAGTVMLAMVLESVGLPVAGIGLVMGVDRIFDMGRTTVNITGDAACAVIVSKLEDRKAARGKK
jgi:Na+/H+-dicarboxylate symporter